MLTHPWIITFENMSKHKADIVTNNINNTEVVVKGVEQDDWLPETWYFYLEGTEDSVYGLADMLYSVSTTLIYSVALNKECNTVTSHTT